MNNTKKVLIIVSIMLIAMIGIANVASAHETKDTSKHMKDRESHNKKTSGNGRHFNIDLRNKDKDQDHSSKKGKEADDDRGNKNTYIPNTTGNTDIPNSVGNTDIPNSVGNTDIQDDAKF
jgi:uncharacterized protein YxeA